MKFATVAAMQYIETQMNKSGVSYLQMMTDAGNAAVGLLAQRYDFAYKRVTVFCGRGNNGGDGFVVAARLQELGARVTVVLYKGEPTSVTAAQALSPLPHEVVVVTGQSSQLPALTSADFLIDALYGIGFSGEPAPEDVELFRHCNQSGGVKIALDLPSGVEGDSGRFVACFQADITIAMAVYKAAHLVSWYPGYAGELLLAETSLTTFAMESGMLLHTLEGAMCRLPMRLPWSHKGDNGRLAVVCGSADFTGAAVMACAAALRSGVGYVHLLSTHQVCRSVAALLPEVVFTHLPEHAQGGIDQSGASLMVETANRCTAVLFGCGMGNTRHTAALLDALLEGCHKPMVLDADGLNALQGDVQRLAGHPVVLTPHPGEFSRLAPQHIHASDGDSLLAGARLSADTGITLLLKGAVTAIFRGKRQPVFSFLGNDGLAKGGSGDLLAGIIASLLAQRAAPEDAALTGAWLHGRAADLAVGEIGRRSMLPTDLLDYLSEAFLELETLD